MPASTVYSILLKKENAHEDPIYSCAWVKTNPGGDLQNASKEFIVTGGLDCVVKVWSLANNKLDLVHTLEGHPMAVVSVAVSPDGTTIASTSLDSILILWDLASGKKKLQVQTGAIDAWQVAFSPDGCNVVTGGHMGKIYVYDVQQGGVDGVLDTRGKFISSVAWSPNNKYIAAGSIDGAVFTFDTHQCKLLHHIDAHTLAVRSVAFSNKSDLLATASNDGRMKLFDSESGRHLNTLELKGWVVAVRFSPDGTRIATATTDGVVCVVAIRQLTVLHAFQGHADTVWDIHFNKNSDKLLSVSKDKCINIYECPIPPPPAKK
ncbi:WD repeat-containing protein 61 [Manduca sexta]|uniref:WD repeat-containing protein 61 n=1 Tax=Manduca sexta TaxID=7130 RepID=UPI00188DD5F8|nr:WD repeat-containing protein 61 [Manduca sexta]